MAQDIVAAEQALVSAQQVMDNPQGTVVTQQGLDLPHGETTTHVPLEAVLQGHSWNNTVVQITLRGSKGEPIECVGTIVRTRLAGSPGERRSAGPRVDMEVYGMPGETTIVVSDIRRLTANESDYTAALEACQRQARRTQTSVNDRDEAIRAAIAADVPVERIAEVTELSRSRIYQIRDRRR